MSTSTEATGAADTFDKNGYVSPIDVLNQSEVADMKAEFNKLETEIGQEKATYSLHNIHVTDPWVLKLATHPNILKPLQDILGPNLILLDSRFICKYPLGPDADKEAFVAWHQDIRYWGVSGDVVTAWLAVDDADEGNACMLVIPGTHKSGILKHVIEDTEGNLLSSNQSIPEELYDVSKAVPCPLRAGQISFHHGHLVHGSGTNKSDRRRCGIVIRYVSTTAREIQEDDRTRTFPATVLINGVIDEQGFKDHSPAWYTWRNGDTRA